MVLKSYFKAGLKALADVSNLPSTFQNNKGGAPKLFLFYFVGFVVVKETYFRRIPFWTNPFYKDFVTINDLKFLIVFFSFNLHRIKRRSVSVLKCKKV